MRSSLPYPDEEVLPQSARALLAARPRRNVFRMLAHAPSTLPGVMELTRAILYESRIDAGLRELAILRVGHLCDCEYEVHQHRKIAKAVGLDAARIDATAWDVDGGASSVFDDRERLVLRFVEQLVRQTGADPALRDRVVEAIGIEQAMELMVIAGTYVMLAQVLQTAGVALEGEDGPPAAEVEAIFGPRPHP